MKILKSIESYCEVDLFNLEQKYPNSKLLRIELKPNEIIYVCYEGILNIKY